MSGILTGEKEGGGIEAVRVDEEGRIVTASAGPAGEALATEATTDRTADAVETLASAVGTSVPIAGAPAIVIRTAPESSMNLVTAVPPIGQVGQAVYAINLGEPVLDRNGDPRVGVLILDEPPVTAIQGNGHGDLTQAWEVKIGDGTAALGNDANPIVTRQPLGSFTESGAIRAVLPIPLYEYGGAVVHNPDQFAQAGTGTYAFNTTDLSDTISVIGTSGLVHAWQTHTQVRFPASTPINVRFVAKFSDAGQANQIKRIYTGNADTDLGLAGPSEFFSIQLNGTDLEIATQSILGGGLVTVPRAAWLDPLDGTGASGVTLDLTQYNTFDAIFGLPGPALGMLRINGILALYFPAALAGPNPLKFMNQATGMLIKNTGASSPGSVSMRGLAIYALSEHITPTLPIQLGHAPAQSRSVTTALTPVLGIRPKTTLNGLGFRGKIILHELQIGNTGGRVEWFLYRNVTSFTGASWVSAKVTSGTEFDLSTTAYTGGEIVAQGSIADTIGAVDIDLTHIFRHDPMHLRNYGLGVAGPSTQGRDNTLLVVRTTSGTATVRAQIAIEEQ
jgi:hypothetical protein